MDRFIASLIQIVGANPDLDYAKTFHNKITDISGSIRSATKIKINKAIEKNILSNEEEKALNNTLSCF